MTSFLVTASGGPAFPLILRMILNVSCLDIKVIATDVENDVSFLPGVSHSELVPCASDPEYSSCITGLVEKYDIDFVFPLSEEECLVISEMSESGTLGAKYIGNSSSTLNRIVDKLACYTELRAKGIAVPDFHALESFEDMEAKIRGLGYPERKVVLRPISGRGSRGFRILDANHKRISAFSCHEPQVLMDFELLQMYFKEDPVLIRDYFVSEFLTGPLGGADLVAYEGRPLAVFPAFPQDNKWGAYTHVVLEPNSEMNDFCSACVELLGMHGLCNVEAGYGRDGAIKLIEVNPRPSATAYQNVLVGPNNLDFLLRAIRGNPETFVQTERKTYKLHPDVVEMSQ